MERGRRLRFALKTGEGLGVAGNVFGKKFKSDEAVQARVLRFVNHAHPATAEFPDDLIVGDDPVDHGRFRVDSSSGGGRAESMKGCMQFGLRVGPVEREILPFA
jgi:hypothetical protein